MFLSRHIADLFVIPFLDPIHFSPTPGMLVGHKVQADSSGICRNVAQYRVTRIFIVFGRKLDRRWFSPSGTADGHLRVH